MSLKRRFVSGMLSGAGSVFIKTALNILLIPTLLYKLGVDLYGLFVLLVGTLELLLMLDMGFTTGLIKLLGTYQSRGEHEKNIHLLSLGHLLYGVLSIFLLISGLLLLPFFSPLFHLTLSQEKLAQVCLFIILVESAITLYAGYYKAILVSQSCIHWTNIGESLYYSIGTISGIILLYLNYGLVSLLLARLAAAVVRLLLLLCKARQIEPHTFCLYSPQTSPQASLQSFKELLGMSFQAAVVNASVFVSHKMDNFVIAAFLPLKSVGIFEIVFRFLGNTLQIVFKISEGLFPLFNKLSSQSEHASARRVFLKMSSLNNFVICLLLMCIVFFYPQLFYLFSAGEIPFQPTLPILKVAIPIIWSGAVQIPACHYLFVSGHERYVTLSSIITALLNIGLSILFIQLYGLIGVALGTLLPQLIQHQFGLIRKTCQSLNISGGQYIKTVHLKALFPLLVAYSALSITNTLLLAKMPMLVEVTFVCLIAFLCSTSCWLLLNLSTSEKQAVLKTAFNVLQKRDAPQIEVANG